MVAPPPAAMSSDLISESTLSQLGFPNEFPYEFDSTETEDETSDDEDDFFAGLTRRLALSTQRLPSPPLPFLKAAEVNSAESTRGGLGSSTTSGNKSPSGPFSQAPSPPESPVREEVAKIERSNLDSKPSSRTNPNLNPFVPYPQNAAFGSYYYWLQQPPQISHYHQSPIRFESTLQPALIAFPFPVAKQPSSAGTGVFTATTAVKQPSVGTGVFLPKNHPNPSDSRKQGGGGCVKLPARVVQIQHLKTEAFSGRCNSRSQASLSTNSNILNLSSEIQFPKLQ